MKKLVCRTLTLVTLLAMAMMMASCSGDAGSASGSGSGAEVTGVVPQAVAMVEADHCYQLVAGQTMDAGSVCVDVVDDMLHVTYETSGDWLLFEAQVWVGDDLDDLPQTPSGNPKIGHFPYIVEDLGGVINYAFSIPLDEIGDDELCDIEFYLAAHAVVGREVDGGEMQFETAWSDGLELNTGGSWAMVSTFMFSCDGDPEPREIIQALAQATDQNGCGGDCGCGCGGC